MIRALFALVLLVAAPLVRADAVVSVCYNYGCAAESNVRFTEPQLAMLKRKLAAARSPNLERQILAQVVGRMYAWAGQQSPIHVDRGGNMPDDARPGSMDCIDHSTTTTRFLRLLQQRGALRFHWVDESVRRTRFLIFQHYSAAITERPPSWMPGHDMKIEAAELDPNADRFVVDSWFVNNGEAAIIMPLNDWMDGGGPDVD